MGIDVAINYKHDAFMFGCAVVDIERGQFADQKPYLADRYISCKKLLVLH